MLREFVVILFLEGGWLNRCYSKKNSLITKLSYKLLFAFLIILPLKAAYGQVINYETKISIDKDGKKSTKKTVLIQVNNKDENWLSHVELGHNPKQKFSFDYAHILDTKGNPVRKLKKKELITRNELSYQAFYQDDLITEFDLYWNQYPYTVEYSYTIKEDEYLYIAWWSPLYFTNVPTIEASLDIEIPLNHSILIESSENLVFKESEINGRRILNWRSNMTESKPLVEAYSPPLEIPNVKIVPEEFKYGVAGSFRSWAAYGLWQHNLNEGTDDLPLSEKIIIEKLVNEAESDEEILRKIYHYLQDHTRYINVAIDVGGLKSYPASYVCRNKYGDCKALTTYMKAMLKHAGFDALYTKIYAGINPIPVNTDFPSPQSNHVILAIPLKNDTIWLENTASHLPFNYLGTFTQNRFALAINAENSQLVKTPELSVDDVLHERSYDFQATHNNEIQVDLDLTLRGQEFENFRYFISEKEAWHQNEEMTRHIGIKDFKIQNWDVVKFHRDSTFLRLKVKGISSSIIRQIGSFQVINPLRIPLPDFEEPSKRESDVLISFPIHRFDKSTYDLRNFEQKEIQFPEDINIKNNYGLYSAQHSINGSKLIVTENFTLFANKISVETYKDFYDFIDSIHTHKKKTAILIK